MKVAGNPSLPLNLNLELQFPFPLLGLIGNFTTLQLLLLENWWLLFGLFCRGFWVLSKQTVFFKSNCTHGTAGFGVKKDSDFVTNRDCDLNYLPKLLGVQSICKIWDLEIWKLESNGTRNISWWGRKNYRPCLLFCKVLTSNVLLFSSQQASKVITHRIVCF